MYAKNHSSIIITNIMSYNVHNVLISYMNYADIQDTTYSLDLFQFPMNILT